MRLLYCDESNLESRSGDFFLYGGVSIPGDSALALSQRIDEIRSGENIPQDYLLKFNPGPEGMSHRDFIRVKEATIAAAVDAGVKLKTSFILHDIATNPDEARRNEINRICYHFQCELEKDSECGVVLIDRFTDSQIDHHLREKFSTGITGLPYSPSVRLDRILGFHYAAIGQSHMASVVDVVLGSLRFAINAHTRSQEQNLKTATTILSLLAPLYDTTPFGQIGETELFFSPKIVRSAQYRQQYESLKTFLADSGLHAQQAISNQRMY
ncbi:MAG: DUF3800 domain-containing protein [Pseudomonadota bacterium]